MKSLFLLLVLAVFTFSANITLAQTVVKEKQEVPELEVMAAEKFKVYGNCGMCKSRIEKAMNSVEGVNAAEWDVDTKIAVVAYDEAITSLDAIMLAISKAGHDTDYYRADDEVYNDLPGCCQFERPEKE